MCFNVSFFVVEIFQNKFKQIEPIDYDSYIEQNIVNLRKDACTKQIALLPNDDVYAESEDEKDVKESLLTGLIDSGVSSGNGQELCLFVNDCLKMYGNKRFEIKYKYHLYGGNYRQLPCFNEKQDCFIQLILICFNYNCSNFSFKSFNHDTTVEAAKCTLPELFYEVDAENTSNKNLVNIFSLFQNKNLF